MRTLKRGGSPVAHTESRVAAGRDRNGIMVVLSFDQSDQPLVKLVSSSGEVPPAPPSVSF